MSSEKVEGIGDSGTIERLKDSQVKLGESKRNMYTMQAAKDK
jgi:hypothetical protein